MERRMTIEEEELYHEDYQMRMLQDNELNGFLTVKGRGADEKSYYDYDVSGKVSLKAMFEKSVIGSEDIRRFLEELLAVIKETEKYLLDVHCILLNPEYIYYENKSYYFCYYPPGGGNLWEAFHALTEYFVKHADYKEQACVQMVFFLHKETMEENYSLERVAAGCIEQEKGPEDEREVREEDIAAYDSYDVYDRKEHDWIAEQELGSSIMRETENMWTPVKRFLKRHKKSKWGDWDGLYIEEEEL